MRKARLISKQSILWRQNSFGTESATCTSRLNPMVRRVGEAREPSGDSVVMTMYTYVSDFVRFFQSWVANPLRVAAVAPSSESLARLITNEVLPFGGPVLELGVGTGVFTRALLARGIRERDLTLIEFGSDFVDVLRDRFPQARIVRTDASHIAKQSLYASANVSAVVSGLPLLTMSPRKVIAILSGAFNYMRPGARFYQMTYLPFCPVPRRLLDRLGLKAKRIGGTLRNLPPAAVYRISRRQPLRCEAVS